MVRSPTDPLRVAEGFWQRERVRDALGTRDIKALFQLLRQYAGISQTQIGLAVGIEQAYVSRIMRGQRAVTTIDLLERVADGCGMPDACRLLLGLAPRSLPNTTNNGSEFHPNLGSGVVAPEASPWLESGHAYFSATTPPPEIVAPETPDGMDPGLMKGQRFPRGQSLTGLRIVNQSDIVLLTEARSLYEKMYRLVGGLPVRIRLNQVIAELAMPMLRGDYNGSVERELLRAIGSLVALSGVCSYDAGRQAVAHREFLRALQFARAACDRVLEGHVFSLMSNQALRTGMIPQAIEYAEAGLRLEGRLTPGLRADLYCLAAESYANIPDEKSSAMHMVRAEREAERIRIEEEPAETRHLTPDVIIGRNAVMHRKLGKLQEAEAFFEQVKDLGPSHPRAGANRLAAQVDFLIATGEAARAASLGLELITASTGMESWLIRARINSAVDQLTEHRRLSVVDEFRTRARTLLMLPL